MSQRKYSLGERLRYNFDKSMAAGPIALIGWLALVTFIVIVASSIFMMLFGIKPEGGEELGFIEGMWSSLMRTMDAGAVGADMGWGFRIVSLIVTIAGIFVFSALIGILGSGLEAKLDEMRKGRSRILESDQTIILNWSTSIFDIISELVIANKSRTKPTIVIMANKDKVEMEDEIKDKVENLGNTQIICRSGDPTDLFDLNIVNPETCRSIIIVSPEGDDPDSQVIKTTLALVNHPQRRAQKYQIAAEIRDKDNVEIARAVGGDEVQVILADDLISRIVVQSCRQTGLSMVYSELLDFEGCEIYTIAQSSMVGKSYGEIVMNYAKSTPMGICSNDGKITLNPPNSHILAADEKLVIISEDDASIAPIAPIAINEGAIVVPKKKASKAENTLLIGWNRRGSVIVSELSKFVAKGSKLVIAADVPELQNNPQFNITKNLSVEVKNIDTTNRKALDSLGVEKFDHVLVLGFSDHFDAQQADTKTLITLLHIRKIAEAANKHISVVSEMIDVRNRELAEVTRADDFVVSNKIVSLMLAQASENANMAAIFDDLLDEEGSELYMRPITDYVKIDTPVDFYTITQAALNRNEVAIGYRRNRGQEDGRNMGGVKINPDKAEALQYIESDKVIVLSEG